MSTVLVIEDDLGTLQMECEMLEVDGYRVLADLGEGAIATAVRERPDVILLDLLMQGLDGWAVREELLKREETKDIPVIILTALPERLWDAGNMQAVRVLQKPFLMDVFLGAVKAAIGG